LAGVPGIGLIVAALAVLCIPATAHAAPQAQAQRAVLIAGLALILAAPAVLALLWRFNLIRPGSFDGPRGLGTRDVSMWPWWFYLLCAGAMFFAQASGAGLGALTARRLTHSSSEDHASLPVQAGISVGAEILPMIFGLILLGLIRRATRAPATATGLTARPRLRPILTGLAGLLIAAPLFYTAGYLAQAAYVLIAHPDRAPDPLAHETLKTLSDNRHSPAAWVLAASAVLGAPIVEELMFRVFLQSALLRLIGRTWPAIFITSTLFALVHLGAGVSAEHAYSLAPLFVLGLGMGIVYERTRTAAAPIAMHMAFNAYNIALIAF
jgi:membrane protease YdiL (CAAX protease family)